MKPLVQTAFLLFVILGLSSLSFAAAEKIQSLCPLHYPTDYLFEWECVRLSSKDTPSRIFGRYWQEGLRFNRMDRRHFLAGLSIKVPLRMQELKGFNPMAGMYPEAGQEEQFILIDQNELYLGAYEFGKLVFSAPVAVGVEGFRLQNGSYRVDAVDPRHESSLYSVEGSDRPYPMHYGLRFFIDRRDDGWSSYWIHGRDLPGYPSSHGCIGLYDEEMQKEYYGEPEWPMLTDARKLYEWVVGDQDKGEFQKLNKGPKVVIMGNPPATASGSPVAVSPAVSGQSASRPSLAPR